MRFSANGNVVLDVKRMEDESNDPEVATAVDWEWAKKIAAALELAYGDSTERQRSTHKIPT